MKLVRLIHPALFLASLHLASSAAAQEIPDNVLCTFKAIHPEGADFFTSGFRAFPTVGTSVRIDFNAQAITSMVFEDGQIFFREGEATLNRLRRFGTNAGYGGVREGNEGFYIAYIAPLAESSNEAGLYTSTFALTNSWRGENFHLETIETHYGDLDCRRSDGDQPSK